MKPLEEITQPVEALTEERKVEILAFINLNWDNFYTKEEMARTIEMGYIFGELGSNLHFKIDDIMELINIVDLEKNPLPVVEEPIIEEPIVE